GRRAKVSVDLNQLFATVRSDAEHVPLAAPDQLRQAGDRRARRNRLAAVTVAAAAVGLGTVGVGTAFLRNGSTPAPAGSAGPGSLRPSAATGPTGGGGGGLGTVPPSSPAAPQPGAACRADDLKVESISSGGASGSIGYTVTVTNRSATVCKLTGSPA